MTISDDVPRTHDHLGRLRSASPSPLGRGCLRPVRDPEVLLTDAIGVLSATAFESDATAAWIRSLGYAAEAIEAHGLRVRKTVPRILLAHGAQSLVGVPARILSHVRVIVLVDMTDSATVMGAARVIRNNHDAGDEIRKVLGQMLGAPTTDRVTVSRREQEVLGTYVMGDTVKATAARHYIAECTVRTHYRRVTRRYEDAGRPVANKAQLLLAMVSDGWLRLDGSLGARADE